jgi:primary-amine oxidase
MEVIHVDFAGHRTKPDGSLSTSTTKPLDLQEDHKEGCGRQRIPPPTRAFEYLPDRIGVKTRQDLKPLHVIQPEGPSFKVTGHVVEWQKWSMHVGMYNPAIIKRILNPVG